MNLRYFDLLNYWKEGVKLGALDDGNNSGDDFAAFLDLDESAHGLVLVKTTPGLATEPTSIDHLDQQRARPVFRVTEARLHHAHDVEADVESNEVRQGQRTPSGAPYQA